MFDLTKHVEQMYQAVYDNVKKMHEKKSSRALVESLYDKLNQDLIGALDDFLWDARRTNQDYAIILRGLKNFEKKVLGKYKKETQITAIILKQTDEASLRWLRNEMNPPRSSAPAPADSGFLSRIFTRGRKTSRQSFVEMPDLAELKSLLPAYSPPPSAPVTAVAVAAVAPLLIGEAKEGRRVSDASSVGSARSVASARSPSAPSRSSALLRGALPAISTPDAFSGAHAGAGVGVGTGLHSAPAESMAEAQADMSLPGSVANEESEASTASSVEPMLASRPISARQGWWGRLLAPKQVPASSSVPLELKQLAAFEEGVRPVWEPASLSRGSSVGSELGARSRPGAVRVEIPAAAPTRAVRPQSVAVLDVTPASTPLPVSSVGEAKVGRQGSEAVITLPGTIAQPLSAPKPAPISAVQPTIPPTPPALFPPTTEARVLAESRRSSVVDVARGKRLADVIRGVEIDVLSWELGALESLRPEASASAGKLLAEVTAKVKKEREVLSPQLTPALDVSVAGVSAVGEENEGGSNSSSSSSPDRSRGRVTVKQSNSRNKAPQRSRRDAVAQSFPAPQPAPVVSVQPMQPVRLVAAPSTEAVALVESRRSSIVNVSDSPLRVPASPASFNALQAIVAGSGEGAGPGWDEAYAQRIGGQRGSTVYDAPVSPPHGPSLLTLAPGVALAPPSAPPSSAALEFAASRRSSAVSIATSVSDSPVRVPTLSPQIPFNQASKVFRRRRSEVVADQVTALVQGGVPNNSPASYSGVPVSPAHHPSLAQGVRSSPDSVAVVAAARRPLKSSQPTASQAASIFKRKRRNSESAKSQEEKVKFGASGLRRLSSALLAFVRSSQSQSLAKVSQARASSLSPVMQSPPRVERRIGLLSILVQSETPQSSPGRSSAPPLQLISEAMAVKGFRRASAGQVTSFVQGAGSSPDSLVLPSARSSVQSVQAPRQVVSQKERRNSEAAAPKEERGSWFSRGSPGSKPKNSAEAQTRVPSSPQVPTPSVAPAPGVGLSDVLARSVPLDPAPLRARSRSQSSLPVVPTPATSTPLTPDSLLALTERSGLASPQGAAKAAAASTSPGLLTSFFERLKPSPKSSPATVDVANPLDHPVDSQVKSAPFVLSKALARYSNQPKRGKPAVSVTVPTPSPAPPAPAPAPTPAAPPPSVWARPPVVPGKKPNLARTTSGGIPAVDLNNSFTALQFPGSATQIAQTLVSLEHPPLVQAVSVRPNLAPHGGAGGGGIAQAYAPVSIPDRNLNALTFKESDKKRAVFVPMSVLPKGPST